MYVASVFVGLTALCCRFFFSTELQRNLIFVSNLLYVSLCYFLSTMNQELLTAQISKLIQQHVGGAGALPLHQQQQLPQQLIASIASTIQQQMSQLPSASGAARPVLQPPPQSLLPPPPMLTPQPPRPMLTPQSSASSQDYRRFHDSASSSSLGRSDSVSSSLSRASSLLGRSASEGRNVARRLIDERDGQFGDEFDDCFQIDKGPRRRRTSKTSVEMKTAIKIVTKPIMKILDRSYLARKDSILFKRKFKKGGKKQRKLRKKNAEIVGKLFKTLVVPVLRILFIREYTPAKAQDPSLTPFAFRQRLFNAALKVTRKRRANHIQHWRLHNCPKPLIYSDDAGLPNDLFDDGDGNHDGDDGDGNRDGDDGDGNRDGDDDDGNHNGDETEDYRDGDDDDGDETEDYEESQYQTEIPLSQPRVDFADDDFFGDDVDESNAPADEDVAAPPPPPVNDESNPPADKAVAAPPPPPVNMFPVTTKCCDCGRNVDFNSGFPQDKDNDWGKKKVRCMCRVLG